MVGGLNTAVVGDRLVKVTVRSGVTDPLLGAPLKSSSPVDSEMLTVAVAVGVAVTVAVAVAVDVAVAVTVAVDVADAVAVLDGVGVAVAEVDAVGVEVGVFELADVGVDVGVMPGEPSPDSSNIPRPCVAAKTTPLRFCSISKTATAGIVPRLKGAHVFPLSVVLKMPMSVAARTVFAVGSLRSTSNRNTGTSGSAFRGGGL